MSFFYKGGAVIANFLLVPITINYLNVENYGLWLTISSFISWFTFFDVGLGNGLRNKFAEARAKKKNDLAKAYVSSAYYSIGFIGVLLFLVFWTFNFFIDWTKVFNANINLFNDLKILMPCIVGLFVLQLVLKLITSIFLADQNHSIQVKIHFFTQVICLCIVWFLTQVSEGSLIVFGIIFSGAPVILLLWLNIFMFYGKYKDIKPTFKLWKIKYLKDIMGLGVEFFIIQIAGVILFSTDNFIISRLYGPEEVVPYNVAFKYFSVVTMIFSIIVSPYWSSFTEAYIKEEYKWIKKSIKNILKIWLIIPLLLAVMMFVSDKFYNIWIGDKIDVPVKLSLAMAFFVLLFTFNNIFVFFINGVGKIRLQLIISIISMLLNIPLSIFLAKHLNFGLSGIILATTISIAISSLIMPIQYKKIINLEALGIWNK